jgi:hypothetical protein
MTVQTHWLSIFLLCTFAVLSCAGAHCCVKSGMFNVSLHIYMQGMKQWLTSNAPFSSPIKQASPSGMLAGSPGLTHLIASLHAAERGLLVMAALTISKALGWPVVADALSGVLLMLLHACILLSVRMTAILSAKLVDTSDMHDICWLESVAMLQHLVIYSNSSQNCKLAML